MKIVEAIADVLLSINAPLTVEEIYDNIVKWELYHFGAVDPKGAVARTLRKHTQGYNESSGHFLKLFGVEKNKDKKNIYYLLSDSYRAHDDSDHSQKDKLPEGNLNPRLGTLETTVYHRSRKVRDWVLSYAKGTCESCLKRGPFQLSDGSWFLEVHHVKYLSQGGSDTIQNCVAICPNCHRELHMSDRNSVKIESLYYSIARLKRE